MTTPSTTIDPAFAALIASGDHIAAERFARGALAHDRFSSDAMHMLGIVLHETGRAEEALRVLGEALAVDPGKGEILRTLAHTQFSSGRFQEAAASFRAHADVSAAQRVQSLEEAAACEILAGRRDEAARILVEAGTMPDGLALTADAVMTAARAQKLEGRRAIAVLRVLAKAGDTGARLILAQTLWSSDDRAERAMAADELPNLLYRMGRTQEALDVYQSAVAQNLPVGDFRPQWPASRLSAADPELAATLYHRDRDRHIARRAREAVRAWRPMVDQWGGVELRGASAVELGAASFEITSSAAGKADHRRTIAAVAASTGESFVSWRAEVHDLLPGQSLSIRLVTASQRSEPVQFSVPSLQMEPFSSVTADAIGNTGAVLAAVLTPTSSASRFRFEFGSDPESLAQATPWTNFPPPRHGRAYQRLYRHIGEWLPTCVKSGWVSFAGDPAASAGPALLFGAPFAKDRNQLTGIGAHEMVAGLCWTLLRPEPGSGSAPQTAGRICWPVSGGAMDLRDAEVTLTLCGQHLVQNGAALHFWISRRDHDETGSFTSQWALTGDPVPDNALDGAALQKVRLTLPNDPRAWTYTGNNPKEQGARASRYRRTPLDINLADNNAPFVLIFSFGDVRVPPTGSLVISEIEMTYRDHSVLSPAAGATLLQYPRSSDDPLHLVSGVQGEDDALWAGAPSQSFPQTFEWRLRHPTALTHFQISQHPYWPAREVELVAEDEQGRNHVIWSGSLPEGRPDRGEPSSVLYYFEQPVTAVNVTLRILSGFCPERCGLDALQLYGAGAEFTPDGNSCSLSAEINDLTPGSTLYYRSVMEEEGEVLQSDVQKLSVPATRAPILESAVPLVRAHNPNCYSVRANAMGLETELWGELHLADGAVIAGKKISLGSQPTGRHIYYIPDGLTAAPGAVFRLRARNVAGDATLAAEFPFPAAR